MAQACIFCGRSDLPMTNEHIFADWVDKIFPDAATVRGESVLVARDGSEKRYPSFPFEQTVKVVCAPCNNGWMNALERRAGRILGPMVATTKGSRLRPPTQRLIATWAVKTAFVLQYLHPTERTIPESEYGKFYVEQEPSKGSVVWLGRRDALQDHTGMPLIFASRVQEIGTVSYENVTPEAITEQVALGCRAYRVTFVLGHVVFVVFGHSFPGSFHVGVSEALSRLIQPIWPLQRAKHWPPLTAIDAMGGIDPLHKAFDTFAPG